MASTATSCYLPVPFKSVHLQLDEPVDSWRALEKQQCMLRVQLGERG
jgi:hypothetical protein